MEHLLTAYRLIVFSFLFQLYYLYFSTYENYDISSIIYENFEQLERLQIAYKAEIGEEKPTDEKACVISLIVLPSGISSTTEPWVYS